MAFKTDFPSEATLQRAGIADVVVIQCGRNAPASDVSATLADWQSAGISIRSLQRRRLPAQRTSVSARSHRSARAATDHQMKVICRKTCREIVARPREVGSTVISSGYAARAATIVTAISVFTLKMTRWGHREVRLGHRFTTVFRRRGVAFSAAGARLRGW
jgi:hypothetical protein